MERAQASAAEADSSPRQWKDSRGVRLRRPSLILYLDTDALVKLLVDETGTDIARNAAAEADVLTSSRLAYVEARSALARMKAGQRLTESEHDAKRTVFEAMWSDIAVQPVSDATIAKATGLAELHTLRAYDALHLASALATEGDDLAFACWDRDLRKAADAEGLRLIPGDPEKPPSDDPSDAPAESGGRV